MLKVIAKSHREPSRTFQALIVGVAIGVFASLAIGLWQEVIILYRVVLLVVLSLCLYDSWKLTKYKEKDANDSNDHASDNAR
jgi:hypothetical protein